jgi:hypothetical protein
LYFHVGRWPANMLLPRTASRRRSDHIEVSLKWKISWWD